jgi:DNA invertase Pin-like site-specific DNA recombinase
VLGDLKKCGVKSRSGAEHVDTDPATGRAMWQVIRVLGELERNLISERARADVMAAKTRAGEIRTQGEASPATGTTSR